MSAANGNSLHSLVRCLDLFCCAGGAAMGLHRAAIYLLVAIVGGLLVSLHFFHCGGVAAQCASGCDRTVANRGDNGHIVLPVISASIAFYNTDYR